MHHASVFSRRDSVRRRTVQGVERRAGEGRGEEVGGRSQPHRAENQPPCGTGTDRHTRRSAVLTIICGGRAVGAGCKSSHDNDHDDDHDDDNNNNSDNNNNDNNQREVSVKLAKSPISVK